MQGIDLTEEEAQEARSMRYVDAARVVRLASGKFVIFSMTRGEIIGTAAEPEINTQLGEAISIACAKSAAYWEASRKLEWEAKGGASAQTTKSIDELGL